MADPISTGAEQNAEKVLPKKATTEKATVSESALKGGQKALQAGQKALQKPGNTQCKLDSSVFDSSWLTAPPTSNGTPPELLDPLKNLLAEHNARLTDLRSLRAAVLATAKQAFTVRQNGGALAPAFKGPADILDAIILMHHGTYFFTGQQWSRQQLLSRLQAPSAMGGAQVFDPWDGWWTGVFTTFGRPFTALHVWDPTFPLQTPPMGEAQYIQPVTQLNAKPGKWFASPDVLKRGSPLKKEDAHYALNIWSKTDGPTGWVRKYQKGKPHETLPHIAFSLDASTLLWVAMFETQGKPVSANNAVGAFMFVERAFTDAAGVRRYVINGARMQALKDATGQIKLRPALSGGGSSLLITDQINQHVGNYYETKHFASRADMACARRKNPPDIGTTPVTVIDKVLKDTR